MKKEDFLKIVTDDFVLEREDCAGFFGTPYESYIKGGDLISDDVVVYIHKDFIKEHDEELLELLDGAKLFTEDKFEELLKIIE